MKSLNDSSASVGTGPVSTGTATVSLRCKAESTRLVIGANGSIFDFLSLHETNSARSMTPAIIFFIFSEPDGYCFNSLFCKLRNMSSVILSRLYTGCQFHSLRAQESSIASGQLSAMDCLSGSTSYTMRKSGMCLQMAAYMFSGAKLMEAMLNELRCTSLDGSASISEMAA